MDFQHVTVLPAEAVDALAVQPDGIYVDATAGGGGHSRLIAEQLRGGRLIAMDKDPDAVHVLRERLALLPVTVVRDDFRNLAFVLDKQGIGCVDGVIMDLGVSSYQIDSAERGFSYHTDARLDMRMSGEGESAYEFINKRLESEIEYALREYGEEKFAGRIARNIVRARAFAPIETTLQLAGIIRDSIPAPARRTGGNPAKRSFQAIRIAVNGELDALSMGMDSAFERLACGGRLAVITFHSLEDRMVKQRFTAWCRGCVCPPEYPICVCGNHPKAKWVHRKPILPGEAEQKDNRRAHSAKLRAIEKTEKREETEAVR